MSAVVKPGKRRFRQRATAVLAALTLLVTGLTVIDNTITVAPTAQAANAADFNPGHIISDAVFYNSGAMTVAQIQSFLKAQVPTCRSGYTCLKSYSQATTSQPTRVEGCAAYAGSAQETAAQIIYKVAQACGINPQTILVLLEKEQGLVSDTWPSSRQYRSATGYGCPDTADCDANYYGFFNQVYHASYQFKKYQYNPWIRNYQAGRNNTILWNPNSECGSSQVYIQNQATAGLYVYTPYRPNQAALNNLYGTGDGCSAYGNRNFWRMFTDWFGSTTTSPIDVHPLLAEAWAASGGINGTRLGAPVLNAYPVESGGLIQPFTRGELIYRSDLGVFRTAAAISKYYFANGAISGNLGYPISDVTGADAIEHTQSFEFGNVSWKPASGIAVTGGSAMASVYKDNWRGLKRMNISLGYPLAGQLNEGSGWTSQQFQGGRLLYDGKQRVMYWVTPQMWTFWKAKGGLTSYLGIPTGSPTGSSANGWTQTFSNGRLSQSPSGVVTMIGGISLSGAWATNWNALKGASGVLGYAIGAVQSEGSGWQSQQFEKGRLLYDGNKAIMYWVPTAIWDFWKADGGLTGTIGAPLSSPKGSAAQGWTQEFTNASLVSNLAGVVTKVGGFPVDGVFKTNWEALSGKSGVLGYPVAAVEGAGAGWRAQEFQRGRLLYDTNKAIMYWLPNGIWNYWVQNGGVTGSLGSPITSPRPSADSGWIQDFSQSQQLVQAPSGAVTRRIVVAGEFLTNWNALKGASGVLGAVVAGVVDEGSGWRSQQFANGRLIYDGGAKIMYWVPYSFWEHWAANGSRGGFVGTPLASPVLSATSGWSQSFSGGTYTVANSAVVFTKK